jgi:hypothetical protein
VRVSPNGIRAVGAEARQRVDLGRRQVVHGEVGEQDVRGALEPGDEWKHYGTG